MAFLESDRVQFRYFLGWANIFLQADPRMEAAISTIQAVQDMQAAAAFGYDPGTVTPDPNAVGGTRPDSSAENQAKFVISQLIAVDAAIVNLATMQGAGQVGEIKVDPVREDRRLRNVGRMLVGRLAKMIDTQPRADVFSTDTYAGDAGAANFRAEPAYANSQGAFRVRRAY